MWHAANEGGDAHFEPYLSSDTVPVIVGLGADVMFKLVVEHHERYR